MPHDSHTTHEPDRVGREGEDTVGGFGDGLGRDEDISCRTTLLLFGGFAAPERELAPAIN